MSGPPVLAIFAAPHGTGEGPLEFLRVVAALAACGREVRLVETGAGRGALGREDLDEAIARYLEALADVGVGVESPDEAELDALLDGCRAVLRYGDPGRAGEPPLLDVARGAVPGDALHAAGQVYHSGSSPA